jgi:hypothetical protein
MQQLTSLAPNDRHHTVGPGGAGSAGGPGQHIFRHRSGGEFRNDMALGCNTRLRPAYSMGRARGVGGPGTPCVQECRMHCSAQQWWVWRTKPDPYPDMEGDVDDDTAPADGDALALALPPGPDTLWSGRLVKLDNLFKVLGTRQAYASTVGGGTGKCLFVCAALQLRGLSQRCIKNARRYLVCALCVVYLCVLRV